jgi:hypothetical protein
MTADPSCDFDADAHAFARTDIKDHPADAARIWASSAAESAHQAATNSHDAAMSAYDAAHRAHESAMLAMNVVDSARESRNKLPSETHGWSLYFFILGVIVGIVLALAGYAVINRVIEDSLRAIDGQQRASAAEYSLPQLISPTPLGTTRPARG